MPKGHEHVGIESDSTWAASLILYAQTIFLDIGTGI